MALLSGNQVLGSLNFIPDSGYNWSVNPDIHIRIHHINMCAYIMLYLLISCHTCLYHVKYNYVMLLNIYIV